MNFNKVNKSVKEGFFGVDVGDINIGGPTTGLVNASLDRNKEEDEVEEGFFGVDVGDINIGGPTTGLVNASLENDNDANKLYEENKGNRINLLKYGFVRAPQEDFSDDGNRFICYYYDPQKNGDTRIRLSKLISNGQAYLSASYHNSANSAYKYFDDLNGVDVDKAVAGLPELKKQLDDFLADTSEVDTVHELDADTIAKIVKDAKHIMDIAGLSEHSAIERAVVNNGMTYNNISHESRRNLNNAIRETRPIDKDKVKERAVTYVKEIMRKMQGGYVGYGRNQTYNSPMSFEAAAKSSAWAINEFPTKIQDRLRAWAERKVNLSDFNDFED